MICDMHVDYNNHLSHGNVWRVYVELPMQGASEDIPNWLDVAVDVIASDRDLAHYIVARMYPDYESISVDDSPLST